LGAEVVRGSGVIHFALKMAGDLGNIPLRENITLDWHHSHHKHSRKWLDFAPFILISLVLVVSNWTAINTVNFETSDFAANSLLIQDAKSLTLLKGNYSRVGFNHPGPAILYVLGAGEVVFYDWLHIVKSPFSGQLIAIALYSAFWIVLIWRMILAMTHRLTASFLTVSVFLLYAMLCDHHFLTGMWFPHLYFFPFAAMLVAASRLMSGNKDFLKALAISCGFLINGHVSFVPILGIIFVVALAFNYLVFRKSDQYILSKIFLQENGTRILVALGILFLFFVPLLIETLIHFPGPVASYIAFGHQNAGNPLVASVTFVAGYWGGLGPFLAGIAILFAIASLQHDNKMLTDGLRSCVGICVAATLALIFYAKKGVDSLEFKYVGLFYYAVPALTVALLFLCIFDLVDRAKKELLAVLFSSLCLVVTYFEAAKLPDFIQAYNDPQIVPLYESLKAIKPKGRIVLDLDSSTDWVYVWTKIVGLEALAKRQHVDLFCINKNWHILFTESARATPLEVANNVRFTVRRVLPGQTEMLAPDVTGDGLSFFKYVPPDLIGKGYQSVDSPIFADVLQAGWSNPEKGFIWTNHPEAHLQLKLKPAFSGTISLDLAAFVPKTESHQSLTAYVNDVSVAAAEFRQGDNRKELHIPISNSPSGLADVKLIVAHPMSPKAEGLSNDDRKLGVELYRLRVEEN
jgi:hypothetical protein